VSKRLVGILVSCMALAVFAIGCGSGSGSGDEDSLTKAEFIAQGDAICKKIKKKAQTEYNKAAAKYLEEGNSPSRARGTELAEQFLIPGREAQVEALRDLSPPSDDEDQVSAMLDAGEEGVEKAEEDPQTMFISTENPFEEANELAQEYGLKVCGQG
jgi:hypothetical protein